MKIKSHGSVCDYIATKSGKAVSFFDPQPDTIDPVDISWALGMTCRFGGHCRVFYSVAQHCINVSRLLEVRGYDKVTQLYGLLHDSAEAYVGDVVTMVKKAVPEFKTIENRVLSVIYAKHGLLLEAEPAAVKIADNDLLVAEAQDLFTPKTYERWFSYLPLREPDVERILPVTGEYAAGMWISRYYRLARGRY